MVAFKWIFVSAAMVAGVFAQADPVVDEAAAATAWSAASDLSVAVDGDSPEKRAISMRNYMKDPYAYLWCKAPYTEPPCETKCNRNNCFRAFLNARDGSSGKHCPKEAFGFCCLWNHLKPGFKWYGVKKGLVTKYVPYTANCYGDGDKAWDVVAKIDDVCGCTLNHEVTVDVNSDYYGLRHKKCGDKACH